MRIAEIFYSIQGEGELTGVPSVFVRISGCNLRCAWCDTPYASWEPEGRERSIEEILREVVRHSAQFVVITGGEPMIARELPILARRLKEAGIHITIETAGTVAPQGIACDLASISPKLSNSTPAPGAIAPSWIERHDKLRLQPTILREWLEYYQCQLKFVVSSAGQIQEIEQFLERVELTIPPSQIYLMPEGRTLEELREKSAFLVEACKSKGYRYCHRLQIELFGNTRGT